MAIYSIAGVILLPVVVYRVYETSGLCGHCVAAAPVHLSNDVRTPGLPARQQHFTRGMTNCPYLRYLVICAAFTVST